MSTLMLVLAIVSLVLVPFTGITIVSAAAFFIIAFILACFDL